MYRKFLSDEKVSARMLRRDDGERRLTNLLHLGEQIHQAAATHESPDALLRWLATKRRDGAADEVAQLRLESDRNLVQIVTIHKAKGLEFPIVFCPFLWDGEHEVRRAEAGRTRIPRRRRRGGHRLPHSTTRSATRTTAIDDAIKLEEAAESLRLIYVALTRAVYRCYVIAGTYTANELRQTDADGEHEEPPQLARRRRQRIAAELVRRKALAGRHRRRVASPGRTTGAPPRPRPAARRSAARRSRWPGPSRNRSPPCPRRRRSRPRGGSAAFPALPATRRARPPRTTTTRGSRTSRRESARRRRTSRRTTSCAFRAAPAPASACTRSSSASTSPPRPAGTTPSPAACPRIRNSFPACARPSNRRCSRAWPRGC